MNTRFSALTRRSVMAAALAVTTTVAFGGAAMAQAQTKITVSTWGGPNHGMNTSVWPQWKSWVEEATQGRVTIEVLHDLGPPAAQMDLVTDGVADATWIFPGHMPGRFLLPQLTEIPTKAADSETLSAAYWGLHHSTFSAAKEFRGIDVFGLGLHGAGQLFTNKSMASLADIKGARIRVGGGVMSDVLEAVGGVGASLPPSQIYEAASQGVIDGALQPWEGFKSFRLGEATKHALTNDAGFYRGTFAMLINPDVWDRMSAEDHAAIMAVSGERLSRAFGAMMDQMDASGRDYATEQGVTVTALGAEDQANLDAIFTDLRAKWVTSIAKTSVDGQAAIAAWDKAIDTAAAAPRVQFATLKP